MGHVGDDLDELVFSDVFGRDVGDVSLRRSEHGVVGRSSSDLRGNDAGVDVNFWLMISVVFSLSYIVRNGRRR